MYQEGYKDGRKSVRKGKSMSDLISRQLVLDAITAIDECENIDISTNEVRELLRELPSAEPVRCKDCRWGREVCGNIEWFVDSNIPTEYHGYEWFCPNGERRTDE